MKNLIIAMCILCGGICDYGYAEESYLPQDESCLYATAKSDSAGNALTYVGIRPVEFVKFWKWAIFDKTACETVEVYEVRFNYPEEGYYLYHLAEVGDADDNPDNHPAPPPFEEYTYEEYVMFTRMDKIKEGAKSHVEKNAGKYGILSGVVAGVGAVAAYNDGKDKDKDRNQSGGTTIVIDANEGSIDIASGSPSSFDPDSSQSR